MELLFPADIPTLVSDGALITTNETHDGKYPFPTNGSNGKSGGAHKNITLGYTFPVK